MKINNTFTALFATILVAGAAVLTYSAYSSKQSLADTLPGTRVSKPVAVSDVSVSLDASTPASTVVVAGKDVWVPFARYTASSLVEDVTIDRLAIYSLPSGDTSDFTHVAVASGGVVRGTAAFAQGNGSVDVDIAGNKILVPKGKTASFELWGKLSSVQASAAVNGTWTGVARSGHQPGLGLASGITTGQWKADYSGKLNILFTAQDLSKVYYAPTGVAYGNAMVLRKSKPIVTKLPVANTVLYGSGMESEIYRFQLGADSAGPISLKQVAFKINVSSQMPGNFGYFRLYRGSVQVPYSEFSVTNAATGADLKNSYVATGTKILIAVVTLTGEDTISGSGMLYSLRAKLNYTGIGNALTTSFYTDSKAAIVTGSIIDSTKTSMSSGRPNIYAIIDSRTSAAHPGTFVWSDNSEVPHSSLKPSSKDWTNNVYVQDLTSATTLSN